jgi:hypothetical protein
LFAEFKPQAVQMDKERARGLLRFFLQTGNGVSITRQNCATKEAENGAQQPGKRRRGAAAQAFCRSIDEFLGRCQGVAADNAMRTLAVVLICSSFLMAGCAKTYTTNQNTIIAESAYNEVKIKIKEYFILKDKKVFTSRHLLEAGAKSSSTVYIYESYNTYLYLTMINDKGMLTGHPEPEDAFLRDCKKIYGKQQVCYVSHKLGGPSGNIVFRFDPNNMIFIKTEKKLKAKKVRDSNRPSVRYFGIHFDFDEEENTSDPYDVMEEVQNAIDVEPINNGTAP